jgi:tight adherence protein C
MTPIIFVSLGGLLTLALLVQAMRVQSQNARLRLRLASLAPAGTFDGTTNPAEWPTLERLFLCTGKDREEVVTALRGAGLYRPSAVVIFAALRFFSTLIAGIVVYVVSRGGSHPSRAVFYAIGALAGTYLLSKMILRSRVSAHMRQVGKELPFLLDTLLLLLESGVSLDQAFRYFGQSQLGGMELTRRAVSAMVDDLQNGVPYGQALDRWADRLSVQGVRELAALFKQALLNGSELGPTLRSFTKEFADKRLSTSRASIGRKTTQMTVVMIFFMMPALMIVLAGPAVVAVKGAVSNMGAPK